MGVFLDYRQLLVFLFRGKAKEDCKGMHTPTPNFPKKCRFLGLIAEKADKFAKILNLGYSYSNSLETSLVESPR